MPNINDRLFGFELFTEINAEIDKIKNLYPYSNNNHAYNAIVDMCKDKVKELANRKKEGLSKPID
jgi:hypothetical protein